MKRLAVLAAVFAALLASVAAPAAAQDPTDDVDVLSQPRGATPTLTLTASGPRPPMHPAW